MGQSPDLQTLDPTPRRSGASRYVCSFFDFTRANWHHLAKVDNHMFVAYEHHMWPLLRS